MNIPAMHEARHRFAAAIAKAIADASVDGDQAAPVLGALSTVIVNVIDHFATDKQFVTERTLKLIRDLATHRSWMNGGHA